MTLDLTPAQFQVLAGLLDQAIKVIGIRAASKEDGITAAREAYNASLSAADAS